MFIFSLEVILETQLEKGIKGTINKQIREHLLKAGKKADFKQSDFIFKEGDESNHVYIILSGEVEILVTDSNGSLNIIETLKEGDIFGEMGMFLQDKRTASVRAKSNLETVFFTKTEFLKAISKVPEFNFNVMNTLASRLYKANKKVIEMQQFKDILSVCIFIKYEVKVSRENPLATLDALDVSSKINIHISQLLKVLFKLEKEKIIVNLDVNDSLSPSFNINYTKLDDIIKRTAYLKI
jgi:CRP-like cAMP-binding protein